MPHMSSYYSSKNLKTTPNADINSIFNDFIYYNFTNFLLELVVGAVSPNSAPYSYYII